MKNFSIFLCFVNEAKKNWEENLKKQLRFKNNSILLRPCVSGIFPSTFVCASAANTTLSNQLARVHMEAKKIWIFLCFVLPQTKKILRQFFFVGRRACVGGENEAKKIWFFLHRNLAIGNCNLQRFLDNSKATWMDASFSLMHWHDTHLLHR